MGEQFMRTKTEKNVEIYYDLTDAFVKDKATPRWIKGLLRFLPVKPQFVLSGNIHDFYSYPSIERKGKYDCCGILSYLSHLLRMKGYEYFIAFNPIKGFHIVHGSAEDPQKFFIENFNCEFNAESGYFPCSIEKSIGIIEQICCWKDNFIAVFNDFSSRYLMEADSISPVECRYFSQALTLSYEAVPHSTPRFGGQYYNPIIWLCEKENDLPTWFVLENPKIRSIIVPKPDQHQRRAVICPLLGGSTAEGKKQDDEFVELTEGMYINDVIAIRQLCIIENMGFDNIAEAIHCYKLGVTEDPWKRIDRAKIVNGDVIIGERLKGQQTAITKSLNIIKHAITGLYRVQGSRINRRPRGFMFLAGPPGTGKTTLVKALTELLFESAQACIRFDMNDFSQEYSYHRLIGSPLGHIGLNLGGELTDAVKEKPFSVIVFDKIEQAHPHILDKLLKILEEGFLTTGHGEQVSFSESLIVFTSHLGICRIENGTIVPNVTLENTYMDVEHKVRSEIEIFFRVQLSHPEIFNMIGENIIVFDFIRDDAAVQVYDTMVRDILQRLKEDQRIEVLLAEDVNDCLKSHCISDLSHGGHSIGNQLKIWLVNPLARAIFDHDIRRLHRPTVKVVALEEANGVPAFKIEQTGEAW